jgi:hypothetical protein
MTIGLRWEAQSRHPRADSAQVADPGAQSRSTKPRPIRHAITTTELAINEEKRNITRWRHTVRTQITAGWISNTSLYLFLAQRHFGAITWIVMREAAAKLEPATSTSSICP